MKLVTIFRKSRQMLILSLACGAVAISSAKAEDTRASNPNTINLEVFGKAFLYSVNYDRAVTEDVFAGIGFGTVSLNFPGGNSAGNSANEIPVYVGYYFLRDAGSPFVLAGASLITNSASSVEGLQTSLGGLTLPSTQVLPYFGAGWEARTDSGFLFRVTGYGIVGQNFKPWFGATFGYAF